MTRWLSSLSMSVSIQAISMPNDIRENQLSVEQGFRILSAYRLSDQTRIWIITEADRSSTCILLPEEY